MKSEKKKRSIVNWLSKQFLLNDLLIMFIVYSEKVYEAIK